MRIGTFDESTQGPQRTMVLMFTQRVHKCNATYQSHLSVHVYLDNMTELLDVFNTILSEHQAEY